MVCPLLCSERKLQATEYPHNLYIQNYSTATSTCLAVRKWLFSLSRELTLASDDQAMTFIFWQAVDDVNQGHIRADDRLYQLKALQDASRKNEVTVHHGQQLLTYQQIELLLQGICNTHGESRNSYCVVVRKPDGKRLL
jgi:hypothetical protein